MTEITYTSPPWPFGGPWLQNLSDVQPGNSAILGGNRITFYGIHAAAIIAASLSLISSLIVIVKILDINHLCCSCDKMKRPSGNYISHGSYGHQQGFSNRFALYMAIADGLWAFANLTMDNIILLSTQTFPEKNVATFVAICVTYFLGYQQVMNASLALYTYLKVVCMISLNLGKIEWKLHLFAVSLVSITTSIFYFTTDGFGCTGYWFLANLSNNGGIILQGIMVIVTIALTTCMAISYILIIRKVKKQDKLMHDLGAFDGMGGQTPHTTAVQCLSTFIYISILIYTQIILAGVVEIGFAFYNKLEPTICLLGVIVVNSCGTANAYAYFHNRKLKERTWKGGTCAEG